MDALQWFPFLAQADGPAQPGGDGGGMIMIFIWILFFAGLYFLLIAPQRKRQKEHQKMIQALGKGDEVMTSAGIYGTITNVKDDRFTIRIDESTKIDVNRQFVQTKLAKENE